MEEKPVEECKIMDAESLRWNVRCFPCKGFPSKVPTLIGEEPFFVSSFVTTQLNKAGVALTLEKLRS